MNLFADFGQYILSCGGRTKSLREKNSPYTLKESLGDTDCCCESEDNLLPVHGIRCCRRNLQTAKL